MPSEPAVEDLDPQRTRAELERSRTHLLLALEAGSMGTWEWDVRGGRVFWSPWQERLFGLAEGSFDGTPETYRGLIHPDDRAASWRKLEEALAARAEGHHLVHRIVRADGETRWLESHGRFVYAEDGTPLRLVGVSSDVTERVRFERLRERQDEMLGAVDAGVWYCDLPFDELVWDRKVKEHFWLPASARVTIDTFYARLHPDDRERTRAAIDHSIATRTPYDIEYRTVHPESGEVRWVRAIGYTAYDPSGRPIRFDGITVDVTPQKQVAERLAASEQRYEYASRATSNAIWDWDLTSDQVSWNPGVHSVFGYGEGEVEETAVWWYDHIHPEDRERVVTGIHAVIDEPRGGSYWRDEYRFRCRDGSHAWIVDRGYVARDPGGRPLRMIGAMENVTARRAAEQARDEALRQAHHERSRLARLLEQAPASIAMFRGPAHVGVMQNARSRSIAGREIVGRPIRDVFPELEGQGLFEVLDRAYASGEPLALDELYVRWDRDGDGAVESEGYFNTVYQPVRDAAGRVEGVLSHSVDVTAQVRARREVEAKAEELTRLTRALEESNRELDQFAYVASHDLKAPLRGIASLAHFIEEDLGDRIGDSRTHLELLRGRAQRMEALIEGILAYSRAGRVRSRPEPVDTGVLVADTVELLSPPPGVVHVAGEMPTVRAERVPLQQVFLNLIGNALKHGAAPAPRVEVSCRDAGASWHFTVRDNGPGIAPEYHDRIWGLFQTLRPRDQVEGTGIGLTVVRRIVETRGGSAWVESAPGEGASFCFTLPKESG